MDKKVGSLFRTTIDRLSPSQVNVLVAEKVMGWKRREFLGQDVNSLWPDKKIFDAMDNAGFTHCPPDERTSIIPAYFTDISAAWEVREKIAELGLGEMLVKRSPCYEEGRPRDGWVAYQASGGGDYDVGTWWYCGAESAERAICLAALIAVGVDLASIAA